MNQDVADEEQALLHWYRAQETYTTQREEMNKVKRK